MKFNFVTTIGLAIIGLVMGFLVTNFVAQGMGNLDEYEIHVVTKDTSANSGDGYNYANLTQPDDEIFNYDALNPTVEVYVGDCKEVDSEGNCVKSTTQTGTGENPNGNNTGENPEEDPNTNPEPDNPENE